MQLEMDALETDLSEGIGWLFTEMLKIQTEPELG